MTTAAKSKSAAAELASLQRTRDQLHAKVREAKAAATAWEDETQQMRSQLTALANDPEQVEGVEKRVRPGTAAAKLRDQIRERMRGEHPHRAAFEGALKPYLEADAALQEFKRTRLHDRLAELDPDAGARHGADPRRLGSDSGRLRRVRPSRCLSP